MQEDKEPVFDALDALKLGITAMTGMADDLEPDLKAMKKAAAAGHSTATDLADWLVLNLGLPFREAHHVTGKLVALAESKGCDLKKLPLSDFKEVDKRITEQVFAALDVAGSVKSRTSYGGTAPANVKREAKRWIKRLEKNGQSR
jgi:argininosuccinate lyase